ncbi:MAG: hypothetical protein HUK15_02860 [Bacteroidales bacterium]|nr:hypothetical protein [Bacteroidales bacterium]
MKNIVTYKTIAVLASIFLLSAFAQAQVLEGLTTYPESVESLLENPTTNTNDGSQNGNSINIVGNSETDNNFNIESNPFQYGVSAEVGFSPLSQYLTVPLSVGYKDFSFAVNFPFYIHRKVHYYDRDVSAWGGLGDISAELAYKLRRQTIFESFSVTATFPTGNKNRTVDDYIVPMGTGSFDFIFANTFQYRHPRFRVYNNISYRLCGKTKRNITRVAYYYDENSALCSGNEMAAYVTANGNYLTCNTSFDYPLFNFMSLHAGFAVMNSSAGSIYHKHTYSWTDDISEYPTEKGKQAFTSIDVRAAISFSYWGFDLSCVIAQPVFVYTDNPLIKESQKFNFFLRLSKKIL